VPMIDCSGVPAGAESIACISAQTGYMVGYVLLLLIAAVIFFRLEREPVRQRMAAMLLVVAFVSALGAIRNLLFPDHFFIVGAVLFIGSLVLLVMTK